MLSERQRGTVSETRKITKSAMEKKRRARINTSLVELKSILAGMISHKSERFEKMEKADILEMTVKYVKQLQRSSEKLSDTNQTKDEQYKNGVNNCISEVIKYIAASDSCDTEIKSKLLDHLANRLSSVDSTNTASQNENLSLVTPVHLDSVSHDEPDSTATKLSPLPLTVNTSSACPTTMITSPVGTQGLVALSGQHPTLPACSVAGTFSQALPMMSNIPLTIIVPANFYASTPGTACVIPLNIPTSSAKAVHGLSNISGELLKPVPDVLSISPQNRIANPTCTAQSPASRQCTDNKNFTCTSQQSESVVQDIGSPCREVYQHMSRVVNSRRQLYMDQQCNPSDKNHVEQPQSSTENLWRPWSGHEV